MNKIVRLCSFLVFAIVAVGLVKPAFAQPPYNISLELWRKFQQNMNRFYSWYEVPVFRLIRVDQQFIPTKKNVGFTVSAISSARQSFAAGLPDGAIETIHVYLEQAAPIMGSFGYYVTVKLYEGHVYNSIAPKATLLASSTAKVLNFSPGTQKKWVFFELNQPVQSWLNRRFVIVLSTTAPANVYRWIGDNGNPYSRGQAAPGAFGVVKDNGADVGFKVINVI